MPDNPLPDDSPESVPDDTAIVRSWATEQAEALDRIRRATLRALYGERESGLVSHARRELELAGLFDEDSDYEGMAAEAVIDLMMVFSAQGHSGFSAGMVTELFRRLASFENLTPLDDNPATWMHIAEEIGGANLWQSVRRPDAFSHDGGKTWTLNFEQGVLHRPGSEISRDGGKTWEPEFAAGETEGAS